MVYSVMAVKIKFNGVMRPVLTAELASDFAECTGGGLSHKAESAPLLASAATCWLTYSMIAGVCTCE